MPARVAGLTRGTIATAPSVCRDCVWWQSRGNKTASKERWIERVEEESGEWGNDLLRRRRLGARLDAVRAVRLLPACCRPARRPTFGRRSARHLRLPDRAEGVEWVEKSLFLAAIGEARDQGAKALEAFAYRYPEREWTLDALLVHRTVFPRDFLEDFGFVTLRTQGRVELCRLELSGLAPVEEGRARRCFGSCRRRSFRGRLRPGAVGAGQRQGESRHR